MHDSRTVEQSADVTLSKLLEVDAELAAQVTALTVQLENVQEKRHSLQTVMAMFTSTDNLAVLEEQQPQTATAEVNGLEPATEASREPVNAAPVAELNGEVTTDSSPQPAEEPQLSSSKRRSPRASKSSKSSGRSSKGWQHYLLPEFANLSLPEAVAVVLQRQGDEMFDVSTIVKAVFVEEIPQAARSEARNRIANVLSIGLKSSKWYRGKKGQYSLSPQSAKASLAA